MKIELTTPPNTCCDLRDSWNILSKFSNDFGIIVHGPAGCMNDTSFGKKNKILSFSTNLNETDIVLGTGNEKLENLIQIIIQNYSQIKIIFVLGTCSSELIGDDIDKIPLLFPNSNVKIIPVHTSGMRGGGYEYTKYDVFSSLFELFHNPENLTNKDTLEVNIIFQDGMQNQLIKEEITNFLPKLGIKVNAFLNSELNLNNIQSLSKVKKNYLMGNNIEFVSILEFIEKKYNIPFKCLDLPVGETLVNKFYSSIYFDFFQDKKIYVLKFLELRAYYLSGIDINKTAILYNGYHFITNSREFYSLLIFFGLSCEYDRKELVPPHFINSSHKFNSSNKIVILNKKINSINNKTIKSHFKFQTINKYLGLIGVKEFYNDLLSQYRYIKFVDKYNKYL